MNSATLPSPALPASLSRWTINPAYSADDEDIRTLFEAVFKHPMSQRHWDWKYAETTLKGTLLRTQDRQPVAFFGGMPRAFLFQGRQYDSVQNGDVMVLPSERGIFSKKGALYQVASHFFNRHVGQGREYAFAFGFPNARHFTLGVKLGLYESAGRMMELRWSPQAPGRHWSWRWEPAGELPRQAMPALWRRMQQDWPQHFIGLRDVKRWTYRYLDNPANVYTVLAIKPVFLGSPRALLVVREHEQHCEIIDYLGGRRAVKLAIEAAREFAHARNKPVFMLASDAIASDFSVLGVEVAESSISIPVNISDHDLGEKPWLGRLWLMAGDSDFM